MTRKTPPARAERTGNPGKRALTVMPGVRGLPSLPPQPHAKVQLGPVGSETWQLLAGVPWIRASDAPLSVLFCEALDERARLRALTDAEPVVIGSKGQPVAHPLMSRLGAVEKNAAELARLLLLDPRQRAELGIAQEKARTRLDELSDRRKQA